jgi:DNA-binding CsgD family transcriptional regulator
MDRARAALIDFAEAAYNLESKQHDWLPKLLQAGAPIFDHGLGVFAITCVRPPEPGPLTIDQMHLASGPADFGERLVRAQSETPIDLLWSLSRPTMPKTMSEAAGDDLEGFRRIMRPFDFAKDGIGMSAFDPDGRGVFLIAALPKVTTLTPRQRERFQMLAAHFGAGYRLRDAFQRVASAPATGLPHGAEVVIDPKSFRVTQAEGRAKSAASRDALREAALSIDKSRGGMRHSDPGKALELWRALVRGRWSAVDWFDSDGRRYVLGIPNAPGITDPRGLTDREMQVLNYVLLGMSNKLVAYHLGLSSGRVSTLLSSVMRKFKVRTRSELIKVLSDFGPLTEH